MRQDVQGLTVSMILFSFDGPAQTPAPPSVEISNGSIRRPICLTQKGFYRVRASTGQGSWQAHLRGHNFYGPWFTKTDPWCATSATSTLTSRRAAERDHGHRRVRDRRPGFTRERRAGATFFKVGVGVPRKPADGAVQHVPVA
jgi:hypothetical protein